MRDPLIATLTMLLAFTTNMANADTLEKKFQLQLNAMGYNVGVADGVIGKNTIAAYLMALKANDIEFDGKVDHNDYAILEKIYLTKTHLPVKKIDNCSYPTKSGVSRSKLTIPHRGDSLNFPSAFMQTTFGTDQLYTLVFPHKGRSEPEFSEGFVIASCGNQMIYLGTLGTDLNAARDSAEIILANGAKGLIVIETGGEFPHDKPNIWEHGKVWLATLNDGTISMKVLEDRRAFYHSVTVGDVNGDGLEDIIVQYFNTRDSLLQKNGFLLFLEQDKQGNFKRVKSPIKNTTFGSAVLLADLDGDPDLEIIQAGYKKPIPPFRGSFKIFDKKGNLFVKKIEVKRDGILKLGGGVNKITALDFDLDGDNDLLLQIEGKKKGLMLYENKGNFAFEWRRDMFKDLSTDVAAYQWREASVSDVNNDGYLDIVLNGWGGKEWWDNNIGAAVFLNGNGAEFKRQIDNRTLNHLDRTSYFFRYSKTNDMNAFMFFGAVGIVRLISIPEEIFSD